jgi:WD40 repeat protein
LAVRGQGNLVDSTREGRTQAYLDLDNLSGTTHIYSNCKLFSAQSIMASFNFRAVERGARAFFHGGDQVLPEHPAQLHLIHEGAVTGLAFAHDGGLLASAAKDRTVRLWDVRSGHLLRTLEGHTEAVTSVAFNAHTGHIASASEDQTVRLWELSTGQQIQVFEGHKSAVWSVAFSRDGKRLASASEDNSVHLWDARGLRFDFSLRGHGKHVYSVAFSPDSQQLATATHDGMVKI